MSDAEIAYDLRLADMLDNVKKKMWIEEELQYHPEEERGTIFDSFLKLYGNDIFL